jgi:ATP-dependent Lhr-like helicase
MLITKRMEASGLMPLGFVANDYALAVWGLRPIEDPAALLSPDILVDEFVEWVENSYLLRRAFREASVISGLIERQLPGKRKSNRQVTFPATSSLTCCGAMNPTIFASGRMGRCAAKDDRHRAGGGSAGPGTGRDPSSAPSRVSPLAVPTLTMIGRESMPAGAADDELLLEAEALAALAMEP